MRGHLAIMRVDHWFKQVFVLPGVAVALVLVPDLVDDGALWWRLPLGLLATSIVASSNYVLNEVLDADRDRLHPLKADRPVPAGQVSVPIAYVQWLVLLGLGLALGAPLGIRFEATIAALWVMGCIYNVPPVRSKDLPYVDVLSESVNNPIRLLAGWYIAAGTAGWTPLSLLVSYWMVGAYFMALKRFAEFRTIGDAGRAAAYRSSFRWYSEPRLLTSVMFYASASMLFLGAFIVRYRLELVIAFPFIAVVMAVYFGLSFRPDSPVQRPETLYRERALMGAIAAASVAILIALAVDMAWLSDWFEPSVPVGG